MELEKVEKKNTKSQLRTEAAVKACMRDVAKGVDYNRIREKLMNDEYKLGRKYTETSAETYIAHARRYIKKQFQDELPDIKEKIMLNLWSIVEESRSVGDRPSALAGIKEIGKLVGAYEPQAIQLTHNGSITIDFGTKNDDEE